VSEPAHSTPRSVPYRAPDRWRWSNWSLTHRLPLFTAAIVVLVVVSSLALTYDALKRSRVEATYERHDRLVKEIVRSSEQTMRQRATLYRQVAADSGVRRLLRATSRGAAPVDDDVAIRSATTALLQLRTQPDSSLPIELWTTDGRRVVHVGMDVRGDSLLQMRPELRTLKGPPLSEIPTGRTGSDSIQYGALYASGGRIFFWTIVPVMEGNERSGYIAQERTFSTTPQQQATMNALLGNDATINLRNVTDQFWASYAGQPIAPLRGIDSASGDYIGERPGIGSVIATEARVPGSPWSFSLEAPVASVLAEPRATLRRLALISLIIATLGVAATWLVSRRITNPLVTLTSVSEAIARGDYDTRMPTHSGEWTKNEVARLSSTFNRMAGEIETTHRELEQQVEEALAVSQQLELANEELQRISLEAQEARDAAQQANRAKSDFLATMSHELRTPLNAIGGYADIMQLGIYGEINAKQKDALGRIMRGQQVLLSLINDVLNFAKLDAGQVQFRVGDVPLARALAGVEPLIAPQLGTKRLTYIVDRCPDELIVRADQEKLQQIVINLLSNAIKFTPAEGTITMDCDVVDDDVLIRVRDSGVGIPAERLEAIFDPFVQVDRALNRPHEGVGLGLSISRDLARGMNGALEVESTVGEGSVFTLRLKRG
jgi:signal transduction histidine kinase